MSIGLICPSRRVIRWLHFLVLCAWCGPLWSDTRMTEHVPRGVILDIAAQGETVIAVGERGHILVSNDGGDHWAVMPSPVEQTLTAVYMLDQQHAWAVGHDGIILASHDGGEHWELQYSHRQYAKQNPDEAPGFGPLMSVFFFNTEDGIAVGAYGRMLLTHDGGTHWFDAAERLNNIDEYHLNAVISAGPGRLVIAAEAGLAFISQDHGESWVQSEMSSDGSLFGAWHDAGRDRLFLFGLQGLLYRSDDQGNSWHRIDTGLTSTLYKAFSGKETDVYIVGSDGVFLKMRGPDDVPSLFRYGDRRTTTSGLMTKDGFLLTGQVGVTTLPSETRFGVLTERGTGGRE